MKNIRFILIAVIVLMLNACNDDKFFELQRPPQFPWNNVADLEFAAVTPYNLFYWQPWDTPMANAIMTNAVLSDYFKWAGNVEAYPAEQLYKRRFGDRVSTLEEHYSKLYKVIGSCNIALDFYESTADNPFPLASQADKALNVSRIKGELLFMRAYAYYYLATSFCPPYGHGNDDRKILVKRTHASTTSIDALNNAPVATSEIYDLIVSDLKEAKKLLPKTWADGMHASYNSRSRADYWVATAFLSQVYFTMGKLNGTDKEDCALNELNEVIGNGGFSLVSDPFKNFDNSDLKPTKATNSEVIFWSFFGEHQNSPIYHLYYRLAQLNKTHYDAVNNGNGDRSTGNPKTWSFCPWWQFCLAKSALIEMGWMSAADSSETNAAKYDLRYFNDSPAQTGYKNVKGLYYRFEGCLAEQPAGSDGRKRTGASNDGKYIVSPTKYASLIGPKDPVVMVNKYFRTAKGYNQNVPVIRLAELYLNRAMIKKRFGIAGAADDYNMVAKRAWNATLAGSAYVPVSDANLTERMILIERWKELAGEDNWYLAFCEALGYTIGQGDRLSSEGVTNISAPYSDAYWSGSIPLEETDFYKK